MDGLMRSPFGMLLRQYRLEAGLTQSELAERAGISTDAISTLERGARRSPHRDTVRLLSEALGLAPGNQALFEDAALAGSGTLPSLRQAPSAPPTGNFLGALPSSGALLGRDEEMERIRSIVQEVADGDGQLLVLAGELGVGKTRLAQEVMASAAARGFVVGAGRCYELERNTPYYSILDALLGIAAGSPPAIRAEMERLAAEIQRLMLGVAATNDPSKNPEDERRIFTAVADFLAAVARTSPVALLLDDLHWVDRSTVKLLLHLARVTPGSRTLLVCTFRDAGLREEHPTLAGALLDLSRERLVERITLRRLSVDETAALVTALLGNVSDEFTDFVHRRTRGNPRFIAQLVQALGGRLHLQREIGAGATGRVFAARDRRTGELVAAKIMVARGGIDPDTLARFQQEGAMLAALTHPNIVDVYDTFTEEHASCIIMELLEGPSLGELLRAGPLPLPRAKHIILQIAAALEYAHAHSIAHRDIKPDNVMVLDGDRVKVMDFGLARLVQPDVTVQTIATTGMRLGTPLYMAPEQIEGKRIDGRADIYSYGAVLYHVATGQPPFLGDDPLAVAVQHLRTVPRPPRELNPNLPADWQAVILKALAKEPSDRFQTAVELRKAIENLSAEPDMRVPATRRPLVLNAVGFPRLRAAIPSVGSVIVAVIVAAFLIRAHTRGSTATGAASPCIPVLVTEAYDSPLNRAARAGFLRAAAKLGVQNPPVYTVRPNRDYTVALERAAAQSPCLVVVEGLLQSNVLTGISARYPHVRFALVDTLTLDAAGTSFVNRPNVADLVFQTQESGYLVGYLAGLMEKARVGKATHYTIGVMGGISTPQVNAYIDGYWQGAHAALPRVKILSAYAHSFVDQGTGRAIGREQIASGADILFAVAGDAGLGYMDAARQGGVYAIGVDVDQGALGRYVLTSALKRFDTAIYAAILQAAAGRFMGGIQNIGLAQGDTGIGRPSSLVPTSIVARVNAQAEKIVRGQIQVQS